MLISIELKEFLDAWEYICPEFGESTCGYGVRVEKGDDLDSAMRNACESDKPVLIEVLIDPEKMAAGTNRVDQQVPARFSVGPSLSADSGTGTFNRTAYIKLPYHLV